MKIHEKTSILLLIVFVFYCTAAETSTSNDDQVCLKEDVTCSDQNHLKIHWSLNDLDQEDPILIDALRNEILLPPSDKPLNLLSWSAKRFNGQFGQPQKVEEILGLKRPKKVKKNKKNKRKTGFFVEAGASCGEYLSNSLYFELYYGWTGLLVEPNPEFIVKLKSKHRNAWILPHCLSTKRTPEVVTFDASLYNGGIVLEGKPLPSTLGKSKLKPTQQNIITVQCFPLYSVLLALGNPAITFFSLDIEGAELAVLKTLPWNKVNITLMDIEINHAGDIFPGTREEIHDFLLSHDYTFKGTATIDDFFLRNTKK